MRDARFAPENAHRNHQHHSLSLSPLFARQIELEKEMADRGRDRYYTTVARNTERNAEANTSYGKMLLKRGIEPMARAISEFMESARQGGAGRRHKAVGMLEGMDVQVVAFIALRKVLDTFSQSMPYQRVSILVGREVERPMAGGKEYGIRPQSYSGTLCPLREWESAKKQSRNNQNLRA